MRRRPVVLKAASSPRSNLLKVPSLLRRNFAGCGRGSSGQSTRSLIYHNCAQRLSLFTFSYISSDFKHTQSPWVAKVEKVRHRHSLCSFRLNLTFEQAAKSSLSRHQRKTKRTSMMTSWHSRPSKQRVRGAALSVRQNFSDHFLQMRKPERKWPTRQKARDQ